MLRGITFGSLECWFSNIIVFRIVFTEQTYNCLANKTSLLVKVWQKKIKNAERFGKIYQPCCGQRVVIVCVAYDSFNSAHFLSDH